MSFEQLQFDRAQYGGEPVSLEHCAWCVRGISGEFFRANGSPICVQCAERARQVLPEDSRKVLWRATSVGAVTAVGACLAYLLLIELLRKFGGGYGMAFGAIGVGYAIGRAMQTAAKGAGGRRYQVVAALLTYAAITVGLAADLLGVASMPMWAFPLLAFTPLINLFLGNYHLGLLELFVAGIGIRWAWAQVRWHGLKIEGPETFPSLRDTAL